jgi:hypothetical protein
VADDERFVVRAYDELGRACVCDASAMKFTRLYSDESGGSNLEDVEVGFEQAEFAPPAPPVDLAAAVPASAHLFIRAASGWLDPAHPAPARQFMVLLTGVIEVEAGGQKRRFNAGDVILAEDTDGQGHATRVIEDCVIAVTRL